MKETSLEFVEGECAVSEQNHQPGDSQSSEFERLGDEQQMSIVREFLVFLVENKKWWMIPIILVLGLVGLVVVFGSTGAAPFIYTLF